MKFSKGKDKLPTIVEQEKQIADQKIEIEKQAEEIRKQSEAIARMLDPEAFAEDVTEDVTLPATILKAKL